MTSALAFEIGGVFLLAALFMFGTVGGFIPRSFRLGSGMVVMLGIGLLGFAVYEYGWDVIHMLTPSEAPRVHSAPQIAAPEHQQKTALRARHVEPIAAAPAVTVIEAPATPATPSVEPVFAPAPELELEPIPADPCEKTPYQSKFKRWAKSFGCATHIIRHK